MRSLVPVASTNESPRGRWPQRADVARLHYVSGKGGTGKSTVAAALALALAAGGRKVLLVEVEARQGIAQLFDIPPLPPQETKIATASGGGEVYALPFDVGTAFLEYLEMFYNLGFAGRAMKRMGAVEFVTTLAPGLKDVITTGKIKECVIRVDKRGKRVYDEVVVDAPPTGRIATFLDVTKALAEVAKGGPLMSQATGVSEMLHSEQTMIHLVTLLEALPVQETADAVTELTANGLQVGTVIVNRTSQDFLTPEQRAQAVRGELDEAAVRKGLAEARINLSDEEFAGLLRETVEHSARLQAQDDSAEELEKVDIARLYLPHLTDGVDLGGLYELAANLTEQGVR